MSFGPTARAHVSQSAAFDVSRLLDRRGFGAGFVVEASPAGRQGLSVSRGATTS
jgi:hypothetical protein